MAMTLRLSKEDERLLALLAEEDGVSRQEATIGAGPGGAPPRRGHEQRVTDASARIRNRYAEVLERLGR